MKSRWRRASLAVLATAALASACSSATESTTLDQYVTAVEAVEGEFAADTESGKLPTYPLGGDVAEIAYVFMEYEERLAGWRAVEPPARLAGEHERLIDAVAALQAAVAEYVVDRVGDTGTVRSVEIEPKVRPLLVGATEACNDLVAALLAAGVRIEMAERCRF